LHEGVSRVSTIAELDVFERERPRLVGLAYRITGSRTDADDVVQDAWMRWERTDRAAIERPAAWLTTVTSRLALDRLKAAHRSRETYVGPWLPEAVDTEPGPCEQVELAESLTIGFLAVLERLGPVERVVFLLADVFAVPYAEIGEIVGRAPDTCRQMASRARRRVREERPRFSPTDEQAWEVTLAFLGAAQAGDLATLVDLLAEDAVLVSDGGPDHHAARRPIVAERIPRYLANLAGRAQRGVETDVRAINGQPGVVLRLDGRPVLALATAVDAGKVSRVWIVVNPDKLVALDRSPVR
jgi:RNA polymerase sigma-70 factor (ECF subfamily)